MRVAVIAATICLSLPIRIVDATPPPVLEEIEREEYAVWSVVIDDLASSHPDKMFVILADPSTEDVFRSEARSALERTVARPASDIRIGELLVSFFFRNSEEFLSLDDRFDIKPKHVLIYRSEFNKLVKKDDMVWRRFYKKYPEAAGLLVVHRVGFNAAHDQALVYIEFTPTGLMSSHWVVLLTKGEAGWQIYQKERVLVAF